MILKLHEQNPSERKLNIAVDTLKKGGLIIYPTDTMYGIACDIYNSEGLERIAKMKSIKASEANFSFISKDISDISNFTRPISNPIFKMMKKVLPGPYTFLLTANDKVPKQIQDKKKTVGVRIPDNKIARAIVEKLGNPIMSSSLPFNETEPGFVTNPELIHEEYKNEVDIVIDGGPGDLSQSTVIDCTENESYVIREGKGEIQSLLSK